MAAGLPVVATRVGGIPDTISDGVEGLLVPRGDVAAMASALLRLLGDAPLRLAMGEAGARRVAREFSADAWAKRVLDLYAGIVSDSGPVQHDQPRPAP
jgi:glycosyltransferase involved in cell wall biosynthesis